MATPFQTGPVHVLFGLDAPSNLGDPTDAGSYYYGTTRHGPEIIEQPAYFDIMADRTGPVHPYDRLYLGMEHRLILPMTRWDGYLDELLSSPNPRIPRVPTGFVDNIPRARQGTEGRFDRGAMMSARGAIQILFLLQNGGADPNAIVARDEQMILWRRYWKCVGIGPHSPVWGNKESLRLRVYQAQAVTLSDASAVTDNKIPQFYLYQQDTQDLPNGFRSVDLD